MSETKRVPKIHSFEFVDEDKHFVMCTDLGFRLHESGSGKLKVSTENILGGLSLSQPYLNSNIFFIVGTGKNVDFPTNKLCLWDDAKQSVVAEVLFAEQIVDLKVKGSWIIVASAEILRLFNLQQDSGMEIALAEIPTKITRKGMVAVKDYQDQGVKIVIPYP